MPTPLCEDDKKQSGYYTVTALAKIIYYSVLAIWNHRSWKRFKITSYCFLRCS